MYETKNILLKEKPESRMTDFVGGNKTGIPTSMKNQYEAASGLSFDDVRIHYNSDKPRRLQALAYTQGNRVYIAPGQEKHLRHELGHVVQQKRGLVRPNAWRGGFPVNDNPVLEQQAESGILPVGKSVSEGGRDVVQGVFLKRVKDEDGSGYWAESEQNVGMNTINKKVSEIFGFFREIREDDLIHKLSLEVNSKLLAISRGGDIWEIISILSSLHSDSAQRDKEIANVLNNDCCNWLWNMAERIKNSSSEKLAAYVSLADYVSNLLQNRLSAPDAPEGGGTLADRALVYGAKDRKSYLDLFEEINGVKGIIDQVKALPEGDKKTQLKRLIRYDILGYLRLQKRFDKDFKMGEMPLPGLAAHFQSAFGENLDFSGEEMGSVGEVPRRDGLPVTYATERDEQTELPALNVLSTALRDREPVPRTGDQVDVALANAILTELEQSRSRERLVIYRGMGAVEALKILEIFHSSKAAALEAAIRGGSLDLRSSDIAPLGKHYGEYAQAAGYGLIPNSSDRGYANVLLAFVLKPGAQELLFSKSLLALPVLEREREGNFWRQLRQSHDGFSTVRANEGAKAGRIGVKPEQVDGANTYSLGVTQGSQSRILLQLLIDRVEVRRILF